jgi:hypothetical protein
VVRLSDAGRRQIGRGCQLHREYFLAPVMTARGRNDQERQNDQYCGETLSNHRDKILRSTPENNSLIKMGLQQLRSSDYEEEKYLGEVGNPLDPPADDER